MTDFYQIVSMSRPYSMLSGRAITASTLRNLSVSCMLLLRFSLFEAVEKSVEYCISTLDYCWLAECNMAKHALVAIGCYYSKNCQYFFARQHFL